MYFDSMNLAKIIIDNPDNFQHILYCNSKIIIYEVDIKITEKLVRNILTKSRK